MGVGGEYAVRAHCCIGDQNASLRAGWGDDRTGKMTWRVMDASRRGNDG